jgi:DNA gyrase inhibitor GyrI
MNTSKVRIEKLEPMRVASVRIVSEHPEAAAWQLLREWAEPRGLLKDLQQHPVFGFNNPNPSPDRKDYGYEFWIRVEPDAVSEGPVEVKDVTGGRFAVMTHRGCPNPQAWKRIWQWVQDNGFHWRKTHELERLLDPLAREDEMTSDLYLPIED